MEIASDGSAGLTRNPEVGAASIHNNLELLRRCADGDGTEIYLLLALFQILGSWLVH